MAAGGAVSCALALLVPLTDARGHVALVERIIALGPLVVVPLALAATGSPRPPSWGRIGLSVAALLVLGSMLWWPRGQVAAALIVPWVVGTFGLALSAARRLLARRGVRPLAETCIDLGFVYLPVGALWLAASRLGFRPMGFSDDIVLLTGAHFHYAGLAAPVVAGVGGRALVEASVRVRRAWAVSATLVALGPPLVAIGITLSPLVEVVSAVVLALGVLALAWLLAFEIAPKVPSALSRVLLVVASGSLVVTMALACAYAWSEWTGTSLVSIPTMAAVHGVANSVGFAIPALLGLGLARLRAAA